MNKEMFKNSMLDALKDRGFDKAGIQVSYKVNTANEFFVLKKEGVATMPLISVDEMYKKYQNGETVADVANYCYEISLSGPDTTIKECLNPIRFIPQLINKSKNEDYLKTTVHREMDDLALVYRAVVKEDEYGIQSYVISNNILKDLSLTEADLYRKVVIENSDYDIKGLAETLAEIMNMPVEMLGSDPMNDFITVVTNGSKMYGAAMVLNPVVKALLSEKYPEGYYLLPSSIHEMLAVPKDMMSIDECRDMVRDVNVTEVAEEDLLSDEIYISCNEGIKIAI